MDLLDAITRAVALGSQTSNSGGFFGKIASYFAAQRAQQEAPPQDSIYDDQALPGARRTQKSLYNFEGTPRREITLDRRMLLGSMGEEQNPITLLGG